MPVATQDVCLQITCSLIFFTWLCNLACSVTQSGCGPTSTHFFLLKEFILCWAQKKMQPSPKHTTGTLASARLTMLNVFGLDLSVHVSHKGPQQIGRLMNECFSAYMSAFQHTWVLFSIHGCFSAWTSCKFAFQQTAIVCRLLRLSPSEGHKMLQP